MSRAKKFPLFTENVFSDTFGIPSIISSCYFDCTRLTEGDNEKCYCRRLMHSLCWSIIPTALLLSFCSLPSSAEADTIGRTDSTKIRIIQIARTKCIKGDSDGIVIMTMSLLSAHAEFCSAFARRRQH